MTFFLPLTTCSRGFCVAPMFGDRSKTFFFCAHRVFLNVVHVYIILFSYFEKKNILPNGKPLYEVKLNPSFRPPLKKKTKLCSCSTAKEPYDDTVPRNQWTLGGKSRGQNVRVTPWLIIKNRRIDGRRNTRCACANVHKNATRFPTRHARVNGRTNGPGGRVRAYLINWFGGVWHACARAATQISRSGGRRDSCPLPPLPHQTTRPTTVTFPIALFLPSPPCEQRHNHNEQQQHKRHEGERRHRRRRVGPRGGKTTRRWRRRRRCQW